ncbi:MAG: DUF1415 domain-containing protein [Bernardetiaceae bacterium]
MKDLITDYEQDTRQWLQSVVLGLNLCPFAHAPARKGTIRYLVSAAQSEEQLLEVFLSECQFLLDNDPKEIETTLLIHPFTLQDFQKYYKFLHVLDHTLQVYDWEEDLQVASFHPNYQFAGTAADQITNYTNRSPYPMLHLLRQDLLTEALERYPHDPEQIPVRNQERLRSLTPSERLRLLVGSHKGSADSHFRSNTPARGDSTS